MGVFEQIGDGVGWAQGHIGQLLVGSGIVGFVVCGANTVSNIQHDADALKYQNGASNEVQISQNKQAAYQKSGNVNDLEDSLNQAQLAYNDQHKVTEARAASSEDVGTAWLAADIGLVLFGIGLATVSHDIFNKTT